jgi:hypothetical protein
VSVEISWRLRLRAYAIGIGLAFVSVPIVHLYMAVELGAGELALHALDIGLSTAVALAIAELAVSGVQRSFDWHFEGALGAVGLVVVPVATIAAWSWLGVHDVLPRTEEIRHKHVASGYEDISLRLLPLTALIAFVAFQTVRLGAMRRELEEQRALNAALSGSSPRPTPHPLRPRVTLANEAGELNVDPAEILRVQAQENYCEFVLGADAPRLVRMTLADAEALLPPDLFVRTHRSHLANLDHVRELVRAGRQASLRLSDDAEVPISRGRAGEVRTRVRAHLRPE